LQKEPTPVRFGRSTKPLVAVLLSVLFLWATFLSVSPGHHQSSHGDTTSKHYCLACLFAQGQVNAADVSPLLVVFALTILLLAPVAQQTVSLLCDYRLSPSRAPPVRFSVVR